MLIFEFNHGQFLWQLMACLYFGDIALRLADEVDPVFSAAFCFQEGLVGLLEKLLNSLAVTGEACQAAADCQHALAFRAKSPERR